MTGMQYAVGLHMDQDLVGVVTWSLETMRDQIPTHAQILATPTMLHLDTLTSNPTHNPSLQEAFISLHQQSKCYI